MNELWAPQSLASHTRCEPSELAGNAARETWLLKRLNIPKEGRYSTYLRRSDLVLEGCTMVLAILLGVGGVLAIIVALGRYGLRASIRGNFGAGSFVLLLGLGMITASVILGVIASDQAGDRAKFDQALVKIFGRPPDKLDLNGSTLLDFHGVAQYGDKRYQLKVDPITANDTRETVQVEATPIN
jgi:hypothetical protein